MYLLMCGWSRHLPWFELVPSLFVMELGFAVVFVCFYSAESIEAKDAIARVG